MKPEVRIVQNQSEELSQNVDVPQNEIEALLHKYGYGSQSYTPQKDSNVKEETFEEMVKRHQEENLGRNKNYPQQPRDGYSQETKFTKDDELGFTFKVQIVTDMNLPK